MAALLALLTPYLGQLLVGLGFLVSVLLAYFGIKQRGVNEERTRQEAQRQKEVAAAQANVNKAVAKDQEIDKQTAEKLNEIKQATEASPSRVTGDDYDFFAGLRRK